MSAFLTIRGFSFFFFIKKFIDNFKCIQKSFLQLLKNDREIGEKKNSSIQDVKVFLKGIHNVEISSFLKK